MGLKILLRFSDSDNCNDSIDTGKGSGQDHDNISDRVLYGLVRDATLASVTL